MLDIKAVNAIYFYSDRVFQSLSMNTRLKLNGGARAPGKQTTMKLEGYRSGQKSMPYKHRSNSDSLIDDPDQPE